MPAAVPSCGSAAPGGARQAGRPYRRGQWPGQSTHPDIHREPQSGCDTTDMTGPLTAGEVPQTVGWCAPPAAAGRILKAKGPGRSVDARGVGGKAAQGFGIVPRSRVHVPPLQDRYGSEERTPQTAAGHWSWCLRPEAVNLSRSGVLAGAGLGWRLIFAVLNPSLCVIWPAAVPWS
jgi:hypothetical protein